MYGECHNDCRVSGVLGAGVSAEEMEAAGSGEACARGCVAARVVPARAVFGMNLCGAPDTSYHLHSVCGVGAVGGVGSVGGVGAVGASWQWLLLPSGLRWRTYAPCPLTLLLLRAA